MQTDLAKVFLTTGGISNLADRSRKYHLMKCLQQHVGEQRSQQHSNSLKAEQRNGNRTDIIIQE